MGEDPALAEPFRSPLEIVRRIQSRPPAYERVDRIGRDHVVGTLARVQEVIPVVEYDGNELGWGRLDEDALESLLEGLL